MLIILVTITLVGIIGVVLFWQFNKESEAATDGPTIDTIIESSVDIPEITTNLANNQFIRLSLKIQTENTKSAEELEKREFQVNNIVIQELSDITSKELEGKVGKQAFEESIKSILNPIMQSGEIEHVYIVSYIIQ